MFFRRKKRPAPGTSTAFTPPPNPYEKWTATAKRFRRSAISHGSTQAVSMPSSSASAASAPQTKYSANQGGWELSSATFDKLVAASAEMCPPPRRVGDFLIDDCPLCGEPRAAFQNRDAAVSVADEGLPQCFRCFPAFFSTQVSKCFDGSGSAIGDCPNERVESRESLPTAQVFASGDTKSFSFANICPNSSWTINLREMQDAIVAKRARVRMRQQAKQRERSAAASATAKKSSTQSSATSPSRHQTKSGSTEDARSVSLPTVQLSEHDRPTVRCIVDVLWPGDGQWYSARVVRVKGHSLAQTRDRLGFSSPNGRTSAATSANDASKPALIDNASKDKSASSKAATDGEASSNDSDCSTSSDTVYVVEYFSDSSREELPLHISDYGTVWRHHHVSNAASSPRGLTAANSGQGQKAPDPSSYEVLRNKNVAENLQRLREMFGLSSAGMPAEGQRSAQTHATTNVIGLCQPGPVSRSPSPHSKRTSNRGEESIESATSAESSPSPRRSTRKVVRSPKLSQASMTRSAASTWPTSPEAASAKSPSTASPSSGLTRRSGNVKIKINFDGPKKFVLYRGKTVTIEWSMRLIPAIDPSMIYIALVKSFKTPPMEWFVKVKAAGEVLSPLHPSENVSDSDSLDSLEPDGEDTSASESSSDEGDSGAFSQYSMGQRVWARFARGPTWYQGYIAYVHPGGEYFGVRYIDGDSDNKLHQVYVRPVVESTNHLSSELSSPGRGSGASIASTSEHDLVRQGQERALHRRRSRRRKRRKKRLNKKHLVTQLYQTEDVGLTEAESCLPLRRFRWRYTIPLSVNTGHEYKFEIGYRVGKITAYGESEFFSIVSPIGEETGGEVGVWCRCGCYQYKAKERRKQYFGAWVECTVCRAWQHAECYFGKAKVLNQEERVPPDFRCVWCRVPPWVPRTVGGNYYSENAQIQLDCDTVLQLLSMIGKVANYSLKHANSPLTTPPEVREFTRTLVKRIQSTRRTQLRCADLGAGDGGLTGALAPGSLAVEIDQGRCEDGLRAWPSHKWMNTDCLSKAFVAKYGVPSCDNKTHPGVAAEKFDLVMSNPPFEYAFQFICVALNMLRQPAGTPNQATIAPLEPADPNATPQSASSVALPSAPIVSTVTPTHVSDCDDSTLTSRTPATVDELLAENRRLRERLRNLSSATTPNVDTNDRQVEPANTSAHVRSGLRSGRSDAPTRADMHTSAASNHGSASVSFDDDEPRLLFLLPSDFFEASSARSRIYSLLGFHVEFEFKLGHLCYYKDNPLAQKLSVDSLFVLKRGRRKKFEHTVVNARSAGMLA